MKKSQTNRNFLRFRRRFYNIRNAVTLLLRASKKYFILHWLFSITIAAVSFLPLFFWKELLNKLISDAEIQNTACSITVLAILYCLLILLTKLLNTLGQIVSYKYNDEIDYYIDNLLISKTAYADLAFFDSSGLKDRLNNVTNLINGVAKNIPVCLFSIVQSFIWIVASLVIVSQISPIFPLTIAVLAIPNIIVNKRIVRRGYEFQKKHTTMERHLQYYQSLFQGATLFEMKLYDLKNYFSDLYTGIWKILYKAKLKNSAINCILHSLSVISISIGNILVYILTVSKLAARSIGIGDISYYIAILEEFRSKFIGFFGDVNDLFDLADEFEDVWEFLEQKPIVPQNGILIPSGMPQIEFNNVCFKYPNSDKYVLKNCSFTIRSGETLGLVGLNGAGKSTIVKLLCRFYDPNEGEILIDGIDAKEYDIVELRKLFGVLFQDYVRYSFTLRENIVLSNISNCKNEDMILNAVKESRVSEFVADWNNGIDENMTRQFDPKGKELSGGQWQRVSLARTFFRHAPIILLDEPSAALDPIAEHEIFNDFVHVSKEKSSVLISHRLSSIVLCDKIIVLEDGHIVEQGSHRELLEKNGRYAYLFNLQASKYIF